MNDVINYKKILDLLKNIFICIKYKERMKKLFFIYNMLNVDGS